MQVKQKLPRLIKKPWGWELVFAHTERYVGKVLHVTKGHRLSRQYHEVKEETLMVLSGKVTLELGVGKAMKRKSLGPHRQFHLPPRTVHRMIAETDCELVEVSTPELDDVVRLEDSYGRSGTRAP
ncbi:MAG TPA: cupin domain-containing protein [Myxococcota bacterium]|jgi:quercetin dioxygenase-like cupin family protein|nr:cupin domain-containing protein [Myxococcota bacterium]